MRILFNDEPMQCADNLTLSALLTQLNQGQPGTALALNEQIVPRDRWDQHILQDGDRILLFQVIAGG
ncbi:sulfur carrier protein ThiS [Enterobacter sp.]|uniref:sulfur carrier protein ThiS n=1 Tax=Enterobacter sp. TaxID=42895 RepID=UPI0029700952|nr:sulfur carrier protein ThiS [Enterobacter sp.]